MMTLHGRVWQIVDNKWQHRDHKLSLSVGDKESRFISCKGCKLSPRPEDNFPSRQSLAHFIRSVSRHFATVKSQPPPDMCLSAARVPCKPAPYPLPAEITPSTSLLSPSPTMNKEPSSRGLSNYKKILIMVLVPFSTKPWTWILAPVSASKRYLIHPTGSSFF